MNRHLQNTALALELPSTDEIETHRVLNQARPSIGHNAFGGDVALRERVSGHAPWVVPNATALGALAGDEQVQELARLANEHNPQLRTHDRFGNRLDWVEFHPAWHQLMTPGIPAWRRRAWPGPRSSPPVISPARC